MSVVFYGAEVSPLLVFAFRFDGLIRKEFLFSFFFVLFDRPVYAVSLAPFNDGGQLG